VSFSDRYQDFLEGVEFNNERFVPSVGPTDADVVLIGEAPGGNEVEEREPFVGRAGKVLDSTLRDIGVERSEVYITNLVKVRPPDNRDPKRGEIDTWSPLLERELDSVSADRLVPLGNFASRELLDTSKGISSIHGREFDREGRSIVPAFHPAATLYDPSKRTEFEDDLRKAFGRRDSGQTRLDQL